MKIEKLELIININLHLETDRFLILAYESYEDMINAGWKPGIEEWKHQQTVNLIHTVIAIYEKRDLNK